MAFYRDIFKFKISHQNDWFVEFEITPDSYLSVADESRTTVQSADGHGLTLAWQVQDIHAAYTTLIDQDITVTEIKKKWGAWVCYLYDPEKHRIELWQAETAS